MAIAVHHTTASYHGSLGSHLMLPSSENGYGDRTALGHHDVVAAPDRIEAGCLGPPGGIDDAEVGDERSVVVELGTEAHGCSLSSWVVGLRVGQGADVVGASSAPGEVAGDEPSRFDLGERRVHGGARFRPGDRTPRVEAAPARHGERAGGVAAEDDSLAGGLHVRIGHRDGCQQGDGVGVQRAAVQVVGRRQLDEAAEVHHADAVGDVADDGEVVGDEHERQVEPLLEVDEQVDDLRLDRDVERRDRLVGEDDVGLDGQRPGQPDALALATGELVGIAIGGVGREPDEVQQLGHPPVDVQRGLRRPRRRGGRTSPARRSAGAR